MIRTLIAAAAFATLSATACNAQTPERMNFTVQSINGTSVRLVPAQGDSARVVHADSLSKSIRQGEIVRRCRRPVPGTSRVVTWCRNTRANAARRAQ